MYFIRSFKSIIMFILFISFIIYMTYIFIWLINMFKGDTLLEWDRNYLLGMINESIKSDINNMSCKIPNLPIDAPEIMKFVELKQLLNCESTENDWVVVNGSTCIITDIVKNKYGTIICTFRNIISINDNEVREENSTTVINTTYTLHASDVVKVTCHAPEENGVYWRKILIGIRNDSTIKNRAGSLSKRLPNDALKLNVLMFGFDSISRNTFIRKLPITYRYLTEILGAQILEGYNILGDGTPQALIPILTGRHELELPDTRKRVYNSTNVDVYPFIWNDFKNNGYVTGFLEDMAQISTFNYRFNGFKNPPTDHYLRPYYIASEKYYKNYIKLCYGSVARHQIMFDYIKNFFNVYRNESKFMFAFHNELSHDDYNLVGVADGDFRNFLMDLNDNGYLADTLLIIMSDHGHRFTAMRNTLQGKLEERMPFFSFTFPEKFKKYHLTAYQNFVSNKNKLTTPFDIYETLKSVLSLRYTGKADLRNRSLSLFSQIPIERNCFHAYIEPHWCACLNWIEIPIHLPIVKKLADAFIDNLNAYTESDRYICAMLTLKQILWAAQLSPKNNLMKFNHAADKDGYLADFTTNESSLKIDNVVYQIKVELMPGNLLFEAGITHHLKNNKFNMSMNGVSRINQYRDQAWCVKNKPAELGKYCYCTQK